MQETYGTYCLVNNRQTASRIKKRDGVLGYRGVNRRRVLLKIGGDVAKLFF
jgi:hypothetical protein